MDNTSPISHQLKICLADTYSLYLQLQNFHWNVTGIHFASLHQFFEDHYTKLAAAIDVIAENIRTLGETSPGTFAEFESLSTFSQVQSVDSAAEMLATLQNQNQQVILSLKNLQSKAAKAENYAIEDLAIERLRYHQMLDWMLTSHLEE